MKGEMRSFIERLLYPYLPYDTNVEEGTYFPKELKTAFIYTMGMSEDSLKVHLGSMEKFISGIFRKPIKSFSSCGNYPFVDEWSNYESSDLTAYRESKLEELPTEYEKAFRFGVDFVSDEK